MADLRLAEEEPPEGQMVVITLRGATEVELEGRSKSKEGQSLDRGNPNVNVVEGITSLEMSVQQKGQLVSNATERAILALNVSQRL